MDAPGTDVDSTPSAAKEYYEANPGSDRDQHALREQVLRFPIQTDAFAKGDDYHTKISEYGAEFATRASDRGARRGAEEPVVPGRQREGRGHLPGPQLLPVGDQALLRGPQAAEFVVRTPAGIGLGSPETMQLAIQEAGLAADRRGLRGRRRRQGRRPQGPVLRAGRPRVRAIDGPTQYSLYPSNVSAKLAPADPGKAASELADRLRGSLSGQAAATFQGVAIIDANDLGCNILGQASTVSEEKIAEIFKDNPLGQGAQRTPLAVVVLPTQKK